MNLQDKNLFLAKYAKGKEDSLIKKYIADGPTALRKKLGLNEEQWQVIFDYFVFEHNLLFKTVSYSSEFFLENYVKFGMTHLREILDVVDAKYDAIFEIVFDYLAISKEGLYFHVLENRDKYMIALYARGCEFMKKILGISKEKYEEHWGKVLDILLNACCDAIFSDRTFENGLNSFVYLMNRVREHRAIFKHEWYLRQDLNL